MIQALTIFLANFANNISCIQIWKDYDEAEKEAQPVEEGDPAALKPEYIDVIISDTRTTNGLAFSVQILNTKGIAIF